MNKIRITLEIESRRGSNRKTSQTDKLINALTKFWNSILTSNLHPSAKVKILQTLIFSSTLLILVYLLICLNPLILNRP